MSERTSSASWMEALLSARPPKGSFDGHVVRTKRAAVHVNAITRLRGPVIDFRNAERIDSSGQGMRSTALRALRTLAAEGPLDLPRFLRDLDLTWNTVGRLVGLRTIDQPAEVRMRAQLAAARMLDDAALAAVYRRISSAELDVLGTSLLREASADPKADAARHAAKALYDLAAVILRETGRRIAARDGMPSGPLDEAVRSSPFVIHVDTEVLVDSILTHPGEPFEKTFRLVEKTPGRPLPDRLAERNQVCRLLFPATGDGPAAPERPPYGAPDVLQRTGQTTISPRGYGGSAIVLRPEVLRRMRLFADETFFLPAVRVNVVRRAAFLRLLDGSGLPPEVVALVRSPDSAEHAALEAWLDGLEMRADLRADSLSDLPDALNLRTDKDRERFRAVLVAAFGERGGADVRSVAGNDIRSFFPGLSGFGGSALALAAINAREGRPDHAVISGLGFIEGVVDGDIVPVRDASEIRINLDDLPDESSRRSLRLRARHLARTLGLRIRFIEIPLPLDRLMSGGLQVYSRAQADFLHSRTPEADCAVADPSGLIRSWLERHPDMTAGISPDRIRLSGSALRRLSNALCAFSKAHEGTMPPEALPEAFMAEEGGAILQEKIRHLRLLDAQAPWESPALRNACERFALSVGRPRFEEEPELVIPSVTRLAGVLRDFAADGDMSAETLHLRVMKALEPMEAKLLEVVGELTSRMERAEAWPVLNRICHNTVNVLVLGRPAMDAAALLHLHERLNDPAFAAPLICLRWILRCFRCPSDDAVLRHEFTRMAFYANLADILMQALSRGVEVLTTDSPAPFSTPRPVTFTLPLEFVPESARVLLRRLAPSVEDRLSRSHPAFRPFPKAVHPEGLPGTPEERKAFLVRALDACRDNEAGWDHEAHVHGRGHVIRSILFARAICGFLAEKGLTPDTTAVFCALACHDAGRSSGGIDRQAERSAALAGRLLREQCGDAAGAAWERALEGMIIAEEPDGTLESLILKSADRLDGGRVEDAAGERLPVFRDVTSPYVVRVREQLLREADRLQRVTNPLCASRSLLGARREALIELTENPDVAMQRLERLEQRIADEFAVERTVPSDVLLERFITTVRELPEVFPLLGRYCGEGGRA